MLANHDSRSINVGRIFKAVGSSAGQILTVVVSNVGQILTAIVSDGS